MDMPFMLSSNNIYSFIHKIMTEPKYLLTLFEINKLIYERNMIDASDVAPYLFKDGWVKCSEEEPKLYQPIMFVVKSRDHLYNGKIYGGTYQGGYGGCFEAACPGIEFKITHWMPLPSQPPKE
jgi:hypothetical protein